MMSDNLQQQDPHQQDMPSDTNDTHETNDDAAREQRLLEAFKGGVPRGADGLIDFNAAVHLLIQHGADVPTLRIIIGLAGAKQQELQQQVQAEAPKMVDFGKSLMGRPRSSVVGFPPNGRSTAPWRGKR
jgi:hypothetical protein